MIILITAFGLFLVIAGAFLIVRPQLIVGLLDNNLDKIWLYAGAIVGRLLLGGLLVVFASTSKYPTIIIAMGWILVVAALVFAAIGRHRFRRLVSWVLSVFEPYGRVGGAGSVCLGGFLIYAFL